MTKARHVKFSESDSINREQRKVAQWLKKLKFKRKFIGGVDEYDVWKKIGELNDMYNAALSAERIRYDTLLEQRARERDRFDADLSGGERG